MEMIKKDYRFKAKDILKDSSRLVAYGMLTNFFKDMSQINDINYFIQIMQSKTIKEKQEIEDGIIYLTSKVKKEDLKEYEIVFIAKYHQYLLFTLENDVREYYNNGYCSYLYSNAWNNLSSSDNSEEVKFINGKTLNQIDDMLISKTNSIIKKVRNNEEIEENDKMFLEEIFLSMAYDNVIYKECDGEKDLMYDIVNYFKKYPINDLSIPRNMQLSILYNLSSRMIEIPENCAIQFSKEYTYSTINKKTTLGFYTRTSEGLPIICINGLDTYDLRTEFDFLEKMFILFHELGHLKQEHEEFNEEFREVIDIEKYLVQNDREFYKKYHDSFCLEWDADNYAITQMIESYGKQYPKMVTDIVSKELDRKRIDWSTFYLMELEEYGKVSIRQENLKK